MYPLDFTKRLPAAGEINMEGENLKVPLVKEVLLGVSDGACSCPMLVSPG